MALKSKIGSLFRTSALLIASIVVAFLLCELIMRMMNRKPLYVNPEQVHFWKYEPLLGWAHRPGQQGVIENPRFHNKVRINQKGLRDREHSYKRTNNEKRILVLGDSFAWGFGVEEENRFSELLETSLGVEVINAAVSGYSTDQELLWYREDGIKYETDLVVLVFCGNDERQNHLQHDYYIYYKPRFTLEQGNLTLTGVPTLKASMYLRLNHFLRQHSAFFWFLDRKGTAFFNRFKVKSSATNPVVSGTNGARKPFELTLTLLKEIRLLAELNGAKFMIVPMRTWWNPPSGEAFERFLDALRANEFLMIDDVESLPGFDTKKMRLPQDPHWNSAGHRFVADKIKEYIESEQLLTSF